jgi:hypothetical protein
MGDSEDRAALPGGMTEDQLAMIRRLSQAVPLVIVPAHEPGEDDNGLDDDDHDADAVRDAMALVRAEFAGDFEALEAVMANLTCPVHTMEVLAALVCRALADHDLDVLGHLDAWQAEFEAGL